MAPEVPQDAADPRLKTLVQDFPLHEEFEVLREGFPLYWPSGKLKGNSLYY